MATIDMIDINGQKVGQLELADAIFNAPIKEHLFWEVVTAQRAGWRRGTASTKGRSEVRGSTRKIYKQKGTGRARHGSIRAPIFVGGGVVFGPKPRSYEKKVSKKVRRGALRSALSLRLSENKLMIVDKFQLEEIKTKRVLDIFGRLGVESGLIVEEAENTNLSKSIRNLPRAKCIAPEGLNVYDILRYPTLVMTADAVKKIEERLVNE